MAVDGLVHEPFDLLAALDLFLQTDLHVLDPDHLGVGFVPFESFVVFLQVGPQVLSGQVADPPLLRVRV
jgi:hypothetical protein